MTDFYSASGAPTTSSSGSSATIRAEFTAIQTAFGLLAEYTGKPNQIPFNNSSGTGQTALSTFTFNGTTLGAPSAYFTGSLTVDGHVNLEGITSTGATGSGKLVFSNSPALVTPALGTPASGVLTNCTGTAAGLSIGGNAATATSATSAAAVTTTVASGATGTTQSAGDNSTKMATTEYADRAVVLRGYLSGCTLSTAGSSATMSVAAGTAVDSTHSRAMKLAAISKTTSAWAVGSATGGLDAGAIANSTWYHFYVIQRVDTGVVDCIFSLSASAPTLPANYTLYRRIGSGKTNGSAQWVKFSQNGDEFLWDVATQQVSAANPGISATSRTMDVPTGVQVLAKMYWTANNSGSVVNFDGIVTPLDIADTAPDRTGVAGINLGGNCFAGAGGMSFCQSDLTVRTNTSGQVRTRMMASDGSCFLYGSTYGWVDRRGRDA